MSGEGFGSNQNYRFDRVFILQQQWFIVTTKVMVQNTKRFWLHLFPEKFGCILMLDYFCYYYFFWNSKLSEDESTHNLSLSMSRPTKRHLNPQDPNANDIFSKYFLISSTSLHFSCLLTCPSLIRLIDFVSNSHESILHAWPPEYMRHYHQTSHIKSSKETLIHIRQVKQGCIYLFKCYILEWNLSD